MNDQTICCFTGHRHIPDDMVELTKRVLFINVRILAGLGVKTFRTGGALGFDTLAAQAVLKVKAEIYPEIKLALYLPCRDQAKSFSPADKLEYERIIRKADSVTYTSETYFSGCMHKRNRALVDGAGRCLAFFDGSAGGTKYTVEYAKKHGTDVINVRDIVIRTMEVKDYDAARADGNG